MAPRVLTSNLDEQLTWLQQNHREALFNGFSYAPTTSSCLLRDSNATTTFEFPDITHQKSSVATLSSLGLTDLAAFRADMNRDEPVSNPPLVTAGSPVNAAIVDPFDIPDSALMEIDLDGNS